MIDDLLDNEWKIVRMKRLCVAVNGIVSHDLVGGSRLDRFLAGLGHVLELEHIKGADQADFYIQRHYFVPPSARSLSASLAISWPQI